MDNIIEDSSLNKIFLKKDNELKLNKSSIINNNDNNNNQLNKSSVNFLNSNIKNEENKFDIKNLKNLFYGLSRLYTFFYAKENLIKLDKSKVSSFA